MVKFPTGRITAWKRCIFISFMTGLFLWQTLSSLDKYLNGDVLQVVQVQDVREMDFPSISLCGYYQKDLALEPIFDFQKAMDELFVPKFPLCYKHDVDINVFKPFNTSDEWKFTIAGYMGAQGHLANCFTYTTRNKSRLGYISTVKELKLDISSRHCSSKWTEHAPSQQHTVHGRDFSLLQIDNGIPLGIHQTKVYEIVPKIVKVLPKHNKPCHKDDDYDIKDCIESYLEERDNCVLPWRARNYPTAKLCNNTMGYWNMEKLYHRANDFEVYEATGCFFGCSYYEFSLRDLIDDNLETSANVTEPSDHSYCGDYDLMLQFFLTSKGIVLEKEVLAFDLLDLVGNIGGFLGLLLGASFLSLYDWIARIGPKIFKSKCCDYNSEV